MLSTSLLEPDEADGDTANRDGCQFTNKDEDNFGGLESFSFIGFVKYFLSYSAILTFFLSASCVEEEQDDAVLDGDDTNQ